MNGKAGVVADMPVKDLRRSGKVLGPAFGTMPEAVFSHIADGDRGREMVSSPPLSTRAAASRRFRAADGKIGQVFQ